MVEFDVIIVRPGGEVGVKGEWTRRAYERLLRDNVKRSLEYNEVPYERIVYERGRLYVRTKAVKEAVQALSKAFGISSLSPAVEASSKMDDIVEAALRLAARALCKGFSFAVRCRRVGEHPYTSIDVCREIGRSILDSLSELDLRVDLRKPNVEINVEVREDKAFILLEMIKCVGGFPLGSQPSVVCLFDGSVNSIIASWLVMRKGCPTIFVYLDNNPFTDESTLQRAVNAAKALSRWAVGFLKDLYVVPHGANLIEIKERLPERLTCALCKRLMYRIGEAIADAKGAEGIVTGETIEGRLGWIPKDLIMLDAAVTKYPIYRPLIGLDATEVDRFAKEIGIHEPPPLVTECKAFPKEPSEVLPEEVLSAERELNIRAMIERSVQSIKAIKLS